MAHYVTFDWTNQEGNALDADERRGIVRRMLRSAERQGVQVLAWAVGDVESHVVVVGPTKALANLQRGVRVGTIRVLRRRGTTVWEGSSSVRDEVPEGGLAAAIARCHRLPLADGADPLATPWSSHRDWLGYRTLASFDASPGHIRVDPMEVHRLAGGGPLPTPAPRHVVPHAGLNDLLRLVGSLLGYAPCDRRCFRLFAQLALACGWGKKAIAYALAVTTRRVRQLLSTPEPQLPLALLALSDPRLCVVA